MCPKRLFFQRVMALPTRHRLSPTAAPLYDAVPVDELKRALTRRLIEDGAPKPRHVVFLDMLGFSALTEAHPNPIVWDFDSEDLILSETSESATQLSRFQHVLNTVPVDTLDGISPSHLMLFSDCAFLVYDNALIAALSSTQLMRRFFHQAVPVRMGLAFGTWHPDRFSFDSFGSLTVTRSVFSGTGVVRAHDAERQGGKGLRIFLHASLTDADIELVKKRVPVLMTPEAAPSAHSELNYLHLEDGIKDPAEQKDVLFRFRFKAMRDRLTPPVSPDIDRQYTETFAALNRMRKQLGRSEFPADKSK